MSKDILESDDHEMIFLCLFVKGKWLLYNGRAAIFGVGCVEEVDGKRSS
jgi:hypothetical protein